MKNKITIAAVFTACLALCAAVWPQAETVGETPELPQTPAVSAPEAAVAEREEKFEATPPSEKEKTESLQPEPPHETTNEQLCCKILHIRACTSGSVCSSQHTTNVCTRACSGTYSCTRPGTGGHWPAVRRYGLCGRLRLAGVPRAKSLRIRCGYLRKRQQNRHHGLTSKIAPHKQ